MESSLMRTLAAMPASELARLAEANVVATFRIGFDTDGRCVLWKIRFKNGRDALFVLAPAAASHFTKAVRRQARKRRWSDDGAAVSTIDLTQQDWNTTQTPATSYRLETFDDAVVVALPAELEPFQAMRLSPVLAVRLADLHWDEIQKGVLRDGGAVPLRS